MARYRGNEEENDTVTWMPGFLRGLFGLNQTYDRPDYRRYGQSREQAARSTTEWMPGPLRDFFGLSAEEPVRYGPGPAAPAPSRVYPNPIIDVPRNEPSPPPAPSRPSSNQARADSFAARDDAYLSRRMSFSSEPGTMDTNRNPEPPAGMPDVSAQPSRFEGDVRPITYLARGYLRGALPPQGLEAFTRQFRKTADDVLDFYGYWLRFQTEEVTNLIRGLLTGEEPTTTTRRERKINIDTSKANGPSGVSAAAASETPVAPAAPAVTPAADDKPFVEATPPAASEPPAAEPLPDSDEDKNKPGA